MCITITEADKERLYIAGEYTFDPGPLPCQAHTHWSQADWIRYIDAHGFWHVAALDKLREN